MPGERRELPAAKPRVETGPVRHAGDWTGLFIRGDDCFGYARDLDMLMHFLASPDVPVPKELGLNILRIQRLRDLLRSTDEKENP